MDPERDEGVASPFFLSPFDPIPFATAGALILMGIALGAGYLDEQRKR